jgi:WD40 repeat protein
MLQPVDGITGRPLLPLPKGNDKRMPAWSPDGKVLASSSDHKPGVHLWDEGLTRHRILMGHKGHVLAQNWSPDGPLLASGGQDRTVRLWDAAGEPRLVCEGHTGPVLGVHWSPDGKILASRSGDGTVRLWDPADGRVLHILGDHPGPVARVQWSPDGARLATFSAGEVRVWDSGTGQLRYLLRGGNTPGLAWTMDGRVFITSRGDGSVELWGADTGLLRGTLVGLRDGQGMAVSPEGHFTGTPLAGQEIVYVVQTDQGQETLRPAEFTQKYGWQNDPGRVRPAGQ